MDFGEAAIRSVDWARFRISTGPAAQFGDTLIRLLRSPDGAQAQEAWRHIENFVFAQDTIYDAAVPTIDVVLASLLQDRPVHVKALLLDLLFLLLNGGSGEDPELSGHCRERASRGIWLLVREATTGAQWVSAAVFEVLDIIDDSQADVLREWVAR